MQAENRLEKLRTVVDDILRRQPDEQERRCGFVHLYGVAATAAILAARRGLDVGLAGAAGMLHDIYAHRTGILPLHAPNGAEDARVILRDLGGFTAEEQQIVCTAILRHGKKQAVHGPYDELLKDADVLQHFLYNPALPVAPHYVPRLRSLLAELGLPFAPVVGDAEGPGEPPAEPVDRRARLAAVAEELARRPLIGDARQAGPDLDPILRHFPRAGTAQGFDWCGAFVFHCCLEAGFALPIRHPDPAVPCRFAGVPAWPAWAHLPENGFSHAPGEPSFVPQRGDIVVYDNILGGGPHDHIGVVLAYAAGELTTAEGNVGNRSGIFTRSAREHVNGYVRIDNGCRFG
jgi:hypothetical protein